MRGDVALGLARRIVAQPVSQRIGPAKRSLGARRAASATELAEKSSKIATGSGLAHSPNVHALYQPTEPEVPSRTSVFQL